VTTFTIIRFKDFDQHFYSWN